MAERGSGRPDPGVGPGATTARDRRLEREAVRRQRARRGATIAAVSTIVVLGGLTALIVTSPGWDEVQRTFFSPEDFAEVFPDVLKAFWLDIRVFMVVEVVVLVLGLVVAIARLAKAPALFPVRMLAVVYTDVFRGVPTILLIYLIGFGIPALDLEGLPTEPVVLGGIALALSYGAYVAEVYRAGLRSIHPGQREAGLSIGLTESQAMRHVVLPQAVRRVGPPLAQRLHRAPEGRGADLGPGRCGRGFPRRPDRGAVDLQLHAPSRRRAPLPLHHDPDGPAPRLVGLPGEGPRMSAPVIEIRGVTKAFGELEVLKGVDLEVAEHEAVALIGASGLGQIDAPSLHRSPRGHRRRRHLSGRRRDHRPLGRHGRACRRKLGVVFQAYNLFPHLNVLDNVTLGLVRAGDTNREEAEAQALKVLARFGLEGRERERPDNLSGGQQQRVAIARAFAARPRAMLLDEVTSALDPELVGEVLRAVRDLRSEGVTMLLATHEMGFAKEVADRVGFLHEGRLLEIGPPAQLLEDPQEPETKKFLRRLLEAGRA